jgi:hypothetical protein
VSDDPKREGELPAQGIDAPSRRGLALGLLVGFVILHVATPLSYYASDDVYDERFAWRMFSQVREQQCSIDARETVNGVVRPIPMGAVLPAPWVSLLARNRPAVLRRFLEWRCASEAQPTDVRLASTCRTVTQELLPTVQRSLTCATHVYAETTDE